MGILKDLIDQIEAEYGPRNKQPIPVLDGQETEFPVPVVVTSDGRVLAWSSDPPHIRVYAWALQTLRSVPVDDLTANILKFPSGEMDRVRIQTLAGSLRITTQELQSALNQLVREGDLTFKTEGGRRIYGLAPIRWQ
ncbi:hypothetical protein [Leptospirillum ferriphilum]|uniref:Uncharacterized protein n=1 Tax=Leptospirillum ferriphilum YSK TaxID=1441628 RepID=A0A059Y1K5_9BACT|nr:hypothetical protein [Leptospirillum ferriphilum]AIA31342.1 hypothetical protein Y981_00060 [Leptospirillum ferriphilum YSK]